MSCGIHKIDEEMRIRNVVVIIKSRALILILVPILALCACSSPIEQSTSGEPQAVANQESQTDEDQTGQADVNQPRRTVVDQVGRAVEISDPVERIVSGYYISSSACIALGLSDRMVGIEAKAASRPIYALSAPELLELPNVGSAKEFNLEACIALDPDLVILPAHLRDTAEIMSELGIPVILVSPEGHDELLEMIALIGNAAGVDDRAEHLLAYYRDKRAAIDELTAGIAHRPVVYICGVGSYLTTAPKDMYQSSLINIAGGQNAASALEGDGRTPVSYEQFIVMDPDVIVVPSEANYNEMDIMNDAQLAVLAAVSNGVIFRMPGDYEAWDSPVPSGILGSLWLLHILHNNVYSTEAFENDVTHFYKEFYGIEAGNKS